jgi:hypothetical protein
MKKFYVVLCLIALIVLSACGGRGAAENRPEDDPTHANFDWSAERTRFTRELSDLLNTLFAGEAQDYRDARTHWAGYATNQAFNAVFAAGAPRDSLMALVSPLGFSDRESNSDGAEILAFDVVITDTRNWSSGQVRVTFTLGRGNTGYHITGFTRELVTG